MELTTEYVKEHDLIWEFYCKKDPNFEMIKEQIIDYEEGSVTTLYIWKSKDIGLLYGMYKSYNSWDEDYNNEDENVVFPITEKVERVQVFYNDDNKLTFGEIL